MTFSKDQKLIPAFTRQKPDILLPGERPGARFDNLTPQDVQNMLHPVAKRLSLDLKDDALIEKTVQHYNALSLKKKQPAHLLLLEGIRQKIKNVRQTHAESSETEETLPEAQETSPGPQA